MNIVQIKAAIAKDLNIALPALTLVRQMDEETGLVPQPWLSHWDNDNRVRIAMHEDVLKTIQADPLAGKLAYKKSEVPATAERAAYMRVIVITPMNVEAEF